MMAYENVRESAWSLMSLVLMFGSETVRYTTSVRCAHFTDGLLLHACREWMNSSCKWQMNGQEMNIR